MAMHKPGGERGIRTLDTLPYTRFPIVRLQPLGHLSFESRVIFVTGKNKALSRSPVYKKADIHQRDIRKKLSVRMRFFVRHLKNSAHWQGIRNTDQKLSGNQRTGHIALIQPFFIFSRQGIRFVSYFCFNFSFCPKV